MTDIEIIKAAQGFTKGLLGGQSRVSKCYMVCLPLQAYLSFCNVWCKLSEGVIKYEGEKWHHFWITLSDGRIIDPTANQFIKPDGKKMPNLYVKPLPSHYHPYTKTDYDKEFKNAVNKFNILTVKN